MRKGSKVKGKMDGRESRRESIVERHESELIRDSKWVFEVEFWNYEKRRLFNAQVVNG